MNNMNRFRCIFAGDPIDFWEHAIVASMDECHRVLAQMPETSREELVLKTYIPMDAELVPLYMCKADNNGTVYFFCDQNFVDYYSHDLREIRR